MKKFDWEYHRKTRSKKYSDFLFAFHNIAIGEESFVEKYKKLKGSQHSPSKGRREYKRLKSKFGFFK